MINKTQEDIENEWLANELLEDEIEEAAYQKKIAEVDFTYEDVESMLNSFYGVEKYENVEYVIQN